mgnify:CR=1 FL=1
MLEVFIPAFVTLFVVIDPPGIVPMFAALTSHDTMEQRRKTATKAVIIATIILTIFALTGESFLNALGVSIDAFRAAGGILLFILALEMIFEKRTKRREKRTDQLLADEEEHEAHGEESDDISVFPLGIPMIAGPASIATMMLQMSANQDDMLAQATVMGALLVNMLLAWIILVVATKFLHKINDSFMKALTRILGIILAAMAMQLIVDGVMGVVLA